MGLFFKTPKQKVERATHYLVRLTKMFKKLNKEKKRSNTSPEQRNKIEEHQARLLRKLRYWDTRRKKLLKKVKK